MLNNKYIGLIDLSKQYLLLIRKKIKFFVQNRKI